MWSNSKKCAVALTFDLDAESLWRSIGMGTPTPLSRGKYGPDVGVPRILALLEKYSIQATFFVPGQVVDEHTDVVKEIYDHGHEIGHHGYAHEVTLGLALEDERKILQMGAESIEKAIGKKPVGYRSPCWDLSPNSINLLLESGFLYDSSMMGNDFHLYNIDKNGTKSSLVEVPVSWELDDAPHFWFTWVVPNSNISAPSKVFEIWSAEFEGAHAEEGAFILTMHPQIIGRFYRMQLLEKLIVYMKEHDDVWFTTCDGLVNAWQK